MIKSYVETFYMGDFVFVFGTLRKGQPRHYLLGGAKFIGKGVIEGFDLYYVYKIFPGIVEGKGRVVGEVYEIDENQLLYLDEAEDVLKIKNLDVGLSKRVKVKVKLDEGNEVIAWCYIFIQDLDDSVKIESGDWVEFISNQ